MTSYIPALLRIYLLSIIYFYNLLGKPYEIVCPPGLMFNPAINVCDWPTNVDECH